MAPRSSSFGFRISIVVSVIISFFVTIVPVRAQTIEWVRQFGTNRRDEGQAIAKGPSGVYVTGNTTGVFPGETSLAPNDVDAFVSRYDEQGNAVWSRQFGSATVRQDDGTGVAVDQTGVYVVGWSTTSSGVSVVALRQRYNERGDYLITTTPPTLETRTQTAVARSFRHFVNGDGYTTQFIVFSGTAGQTAAGSMRFYRQNGTPLPVSLR